MYKTIVTLTNATLVGILFLFMIVCMYLLNIVINNVVVISLGLVVLLTAISLALPRGITGVILFGSFISFVILTLLLGNIEHGLFYGSIIMSFLVLFNVFKH